MIRSEFVCFAAHSSVVNDNTGGSMLKFPKFFKSLNFGTIILYSKVVFICQNVAGSLR